MAELADAADSKANALHFLRRAHRYSSRYKGYLARRTKKHDTCSRLLNLNHEEVIDKLCQTCPKPLAPNSVRYCQEHLAKIRARTSQKKGLSGPGSREYLYSGELPESTHSRQPGTLATLAMNREKKTRALLAEMGIPPESAAVSLKAAKEALLKCMPDSWRRALSLDDLMAKAVVPSKGTGQKALQELLAEGKIQRIGKGVNRDPFRYFSVSGSSTN